MNLDQVKKKKKQYGDVVNSDSATSQLGEVDISHLPQIQLPFCSQRG